MTLIKNAQMKMILEQQRPVSSHLVSNPHPPSLNGSVVIISLAVSLIQYALSQLFYLFLNTGQVGSEWELVGVTNNYQRGTSERVREKMLKISERARVAIDNRAEGQPEKTSQANKRALEERMEEVEAAVREERARTRYAENRAELAESAVMEERQRVQEAERRSVFTLLWSKCFYLAVSGF